MHIDTSAILGHTDIYLIDQIMKGRYKPKDTVLDAGCGSGRNMHWFLNNDIEVYGIDADSTAIGMLQQQHSALPTDRFRVEAVDALSFPDRYFDHVISSAVLHFAKNEQHFFAMLYQMLRVLKPGGSIFIRMAADIGIEQAVIPAGNGWYHLPDGSSRFLLTRPLLRQIGEQLPIRLLEPFKTVNVSDLRCMSTLVAEKT